MSKNRHDVIVFFDLEGTLINHWSDPTICNKESVANVMRLDWIRNKPHVRVGVFSYAIWCDENLINFLNGEVITNIQKEHGFLIDPSLIIDVPTMARSIEKSIPAGHQRELSVNDVWAYSKTHAFLDLVLWNYWADMMVLVDDTVDDMQGSIPAADMRAFATINIHNI
jgi:hypothetical protein